MDLPTIIFGGALCAYLLWSMLRTVSKYKARKRAEAENGGE